MVRDPPIKHKLHPRPIRLPRRKLIHARIRAIIHIIMYRINLPLQNIPDDTRRPPLHTPLARRRLGLGIGDVVPRVEAAALEGVVEPDPVAGLVHAGLALVVGGEGPAGEGGEVDDDAVVCGCGGVGLGEGGVAEEGGPGAGEVYGVDVEHGWAALAEGCFHRVLLRRAWAPVVEPVGVHGSRYVSKSESQSGRSKA